MSSLAKRLAAIALTLLFAAPPPAVCGAQPAASADAIREAFVYAFPVFEEARVRYRATFGQAPDASALNRLVHSRELADSHSRAVTTPNNDTLYSSAFLDLSGSAVEITTPDFGDRYFSITFMDAFTNNFATIGRRTTGGRPQRYLIARPGWQGAVPAGDTLIRAPGSDVWVLVRILVEGPDDLARTHALQDGLTLRVLQPFAPKAPIEPKPDDAANLVAVVNETLAANPPPAADQPVLGRIAKVGIGPAAAPLDPALQAAWRAAEPQLRQQLLEAARTARTAHVLNGWTYSAAGIGDFGVDYGLRASVALSGLAALPPAEAIYAQPVADSRGAALDSARRYRFHIPPQGLPINAFWSLSAYEQTPDGRLFFADNPIHRYAIGDRTRGLVRNTDGSLDILVQRDAPAGPSAANWLPIPSGPVRLSLRLYQPQASLLEGRYRIPALERAP
jgi:hypothetical protein